MSSLRKELEAKGFSLIPKALPLHLVDQLVAATDQAMNNEKFSEDFCTINKSGHIHKLKYVFDKDEIFLEALVHTAVLSIVLNFIDDPTQIVPTWEDMLIKVPKVGIPVTVHQDLALQSIKTPVFSLGVYLHDSQENPVYYLPGSYKLGPLTRTEINELYLREKKNFVPLYAKKGDITVHNVKTVHFSEENTSPLPRYTWYLEFRTLDQLKEDSPWDLEWILQRRAIWVASLQKYQQNKDYLIPDAKELVPYMKPLNLRVSHTNDKIQYDMESPYNHFA